MEEVIRKVKELNYFITNRIVYIFNLYYFLIYSLWKS